MAVAQFSWYIPPHFLKLVTFFLPIFLYFILLLNWNIILFFVSCVLVTKANDLKISCYVSQRIMS